MWFSTSCLPAALTVEFYRALTCRVEGTWEDKWKKGKKGKEMDEGPRKEWVMGHGMAVPVHIHAPAGEAPRVGGISNC